MTIVTKTAFAANHSNAATDLKLRRPAEVSYIDGATAAFASAGPSALSEGDPNELNLPELDAVGAQRRITRIGVAGGRPAPLYRDRAPLGCSLLGPYIWTRRPMIASSTC